MAYGPRHPCRFTLQDRLVMKSVHVWERPSQRRIFTDVERALAFLAQGWPAEFRGNGKYREALWQAELALKANSSDDFRTAFIVAAAEAAILAPRATEHEPETPAETTSRLVAE